MMKTAPPRTVTCRNPNLTQEEALESLYSNPNFKPGTRVASIKKKGTRWVAQLVEPRTAGDFPFGDDSDSDESAPPSDDGGSEDSAPEPDSDDSEDSSDGPPKPPEGDSDSDGDGDKPKKQTTDEKLDEVLGLLHELLGGGKHDPLDAIDGPPPLGDEGPIPGGPPGGPPGGGLPKPPSKLKPGEVKPQQTPIGSPAFAKVLGKVASFTVSEKTDQSVREAKREIDDLYNPHGYKVKKIRVAQDDDGSRRVKALVSKR